MRNDIVGEAAYLHLGLQSKERFIKVKPDLITEPQLKVIYEKAWKHFLDHKNVPSYEFLASALVSNGIPNRKAALEALDLIRHTKPKFKEFKYIQHNLSDLSEGRDLAALNTTLAKDLNAGDIKQVKKSIVEYAINSKFKDVDDEFSLEELGKCYKRNKSNSIIPTGIKPIDDSIDGYSRKELIIITAKKGDGKSAFMLNTSLNQYKAGYNVLSFNLELSHFQFWCRALSCMSGVKHNLVRKFELTKVMKKKIVKGIIKTFVIPEYQEAAIIYANKERLYKYMYNQSLLFLKLKRRFKFRPNQFILKAPADLKLKDIPLIIKKAGNIDIIYVDYLDWLSPDVSKNKWESLGQASRYLKKIAKSFDIAVVVAAQLNDDATDTKYSHGITEDADLGLKLSREEDPERQNDLIYIDNSIKTRNVAKMKKVALGIDFSTMRIVKNKKLLLSQL